MHYDEGYAKKTNLPNCIAHGMLMMSMVGVYIEEWGGSRNGENLGQISVKSETQEGRLTTQGTALLSI
ncbi:MAG: MaoC family dehydratase [Promethearchaeia archaeon]